MHAITKSINEKIRAMKKAEELYLNYSIYDKLKNGKENTRI